MPANFSCPASGGGGGPLPTNIPVIKLANGSVNSAKIADGGIYESSLPIAPPFSFLGGDTLGQNNYLFFDNTFFFDGTQINLTYGYYPGGYGFGRPILYDGFGFDYFFNFLFSSFNGRFFLLSAPGNMIFERPNPNEAILTTFRVGRSITIKGQDANSNLVSQPGGDLILRTGKYVGQVTDNYGGEVSFSPSDQTFFTSISYPERLNWAGRGLSFTATPNQTDHEVLVSFPTCPSPVIVRNEGLPPINLGTQSSGGLVIGNTSHQVALQAALVRNVLPRLLCLSTSAAIAPALTDQVPFDVPTITAPGDITFSNNIFTLVKAGSYIVSGKLTPGLAATTVLTSKADIVYVIPSQFDSNLITSFSQSIQHKDPERHSFNFEFVIRSTVANAQFYLTCSVPQDPSIVGTPNYIHITPYI